MIVGGLTSKDLDRMKAAISASTLRILQDRKLSSTVDFTVTHMSMQDSNNGSWNLSITVNMFKKD